MDLLKGTTFYGVSTALAAFLLPFVFSRNIFYAGVNIKSFFWLTVITIAGLALCYKLWTDKREYYIKTNHRFLSWSLGLVLVTLFLSSFLGIYPAGSLFSDIIRGGGVLFLAYIAFFAWCLSVFLNTKDWSWVRRAVIASTAIISFLTILGIEGLGLSGRFLGVINLDMQGLTLANTTFAGAYMLLAVILGVIEVSQTDNSNKAKNILIGLTALTCLSPLFINWGVLLGKVSLFDNPAALLGSARASSATLAAFLVWFLGFKLINRFFVNVREKITTIWSLFFAALILISVALLFVSGSFIQDRYIEESSAARILVWNSGLEAFKEKPFLGWGPENFRFGVEQNFDNRLYLEENYGEIWFDRAHNIIVDTLVSVGFLGAISHLVLLVGFLVIIFRAKKRGLIQNQEKWLLATLPLWHFLQMQTGFDTISTYALGGIILGYGLFLEKESLSEKGFQLPNSYKKIISIVLLLVMCLGFYRLVINEYSRQTSLVNILRTTDPQEQLSLIDKSLDGATGFESIRLPLTSLINGVFDQLPTLPDKDQVVLIANAKVQLAKYRQFLEVYLQSAPHDYRARMHYSNVLLIESAFSGEPGEGIEKAKNIISDSYELSPNHPLTYVMHSVAELYSGNLRAAREKVDEAVALNSEIEFSNNVKNYIEDQINNFPNITMIKLKNL